MLARQDGHVTADSVSAVRGAAAPSAGHAPTRVALKCCSENRDVFDTWKTTLSQVTMNDVFRSFTS